MAQKKHATTASSADQPPKERHSFRLVRRRDIVRRPVGIGPIALTRQVINLFWQERRLFGLIALLHFIVMTLLVGIMSQTDYRVLGDVVAEVSRDAFGTASGLTTGFILFWTVISGGITEGANDVQQLFVSFVNLMSWLVIIWLLRERLAGAQVKVRDGLYNAPTPLISTLAIVTIGLVQLVPVSLGVIIFSSLTQSGVLAGGIESAMFALALLLLGILALYWLSATVIAGVIVALPGVYPLVALRQAWAVVAGRRLGIIGRLLWLGLLLLGLWMVVLVPVMVVDAAVSLPWLPLVPVTVQLLFTAGTILISTYVYLLYRRLIEDEAS